MQKRKLEKSIVNSMLDDLLSFYIFLFCSSSSKMVEVEDPLHQVVKPDVNEPI